jgi:hypothetical protein
VFVNVSVFRLFREFVEIRGYALDAPTLDSTKLDRGVTRENHELIVELLEFGVVDASNQNVSPLIIFGVNVPGSQGWKFANGCELQRLL